MIRSMIMMNDEPPTVTVCSDISTSLACY